MLGLTMGACSAVVLVVTGILINKRRFSRARGILAGTLCLSIALLLIGAILTITAYPAMAQEAAAAPKSMVGSIAAIAAALSTGLACIGAGVAVGSVGSAALGLIGEKPDMLGKTLIYLGLAEGIAIYGMLISILILYT